MDFLNNTGTILDVIIGFSIVVGGGIAAFFLIRYQVSKNLSDTIEIYRKEVEAYKGRVERIEKEFSALKDQYDELKKKKNYLKQILLEALATKSDIKDLLIKTLKEDSKQ